MIGVINLYICSNYSMVCINDIITGKLMACSSSLKLMNQILFLSDAWFPDELNDGKAENIYFLAAGIMCLGLLLLIVYSKFSNKASSNRCTLSK